MELWSEFIPHFCLYNFRKSNAEEGAPPYWPWLQLLHSYVQQQAPEHLKAEMGAGAADIAEV